MSKWFNTTPERLYQALTSAADLGRWMAPEGTKLEVVKLEPHPGGIFHYSMTMPSGVVMWGKWTFVEMVPGQRLVVENSFSDASEAITVHPMSATWPLVTRSTSTIEAKDDGALLTLEWLAWHATAEQQATFDGAHAGMRMGWSGAFSQLEALLAKG